MTRALATAAVDLLSFNARSSGFSGAASGLLWMEKFAVSIVSPSADDELVVVSTAGELPLTLRDLAGGVVRGLGVLGECTEMIVLFEEHLT